MAVTYVLLDTNVFLHFQPVEDILWTEVLDCSPIQLIVAGVVVRELDEQKNINSSAKIRDRARRVLKRIEGWGRSDDPVKLRENVTLEVWLENPAVDWKALALDPSWRDDRLVAAAKWLDENRGPGSVLLVSDDTGPRLRSGQLGLRASELPDDLRLPAQLNPLEDENSRLKAEIARLKERPVPDLSLEFAHEQDAENRFHLSVPQHLTPEEIRTWIEERMSNVQEKHTPYRVRNVDSAMMGHVVPTAREIERYNRELGEYFNKYRAYLEKVVRNKEDTRLHFTFPFRLYNSGKAPADDIDVSIRFTGTFLLIPKMSPFGPTAPKPPKPPRTHQQILADRMSYAGLDVAGLIHTPSIPQEPPNVGGPDVQELEGGYDVRFTVRRLKHGFHVDLGSVEAWYEDDGSVESMTLGYWIHCANLPGQTKGDMHVVFSHAGEAPVRDA